METYCLSGKPLYATCANLAGNYFEVDEEENMEDFECLTECQETEFTGKLDPSKEPPAFVEETEEVES